MCNKLCEVDFTWSSCDFCILLEVCKKLLEKVLYQGSRLTFQLSSQVASERFDFTSQNKFSLARLFLQNLILCSICLIFSRVKYCKHASM